MDDPCSQCEKRELRNLFMRHYHERISKLVASANTSPDNDDMTHLNKYKYLIDNAPDAIFFADAETGTILEANQKASELLGIPVDEIVGMHQSQLHPQEEAQRYKEIFQESIIKRTGSITENVYVQHKSGRKIPVQINAAVLNLQNKSVIYGIFTDISNQTQQEQEIKAVFESSQDGIIVVDKNYNNLYVNQAALEQVNITPDKGTGKTIYESLGHIPDMLELWKSRIDEVFRTGKPMRVQDDMPINGQQVYSESILSPICYPSGKMFAVSIVYRDITETKTLQKKIEQDEKRYRELYKNAQVALFRTRINGGQVLNCSRATANMFGYTDEKEFLGSNVIQSYVNPKDRDDFLEALSNKGRVDNFEVQLKRKDDTPFWVAITAAVFPKSDYIEGVIYDITASKVLTKTEKKILTHILYGESNKEIANRLNRSIRTIEDHRAHIMQKLHAHNIVELVQYAQSLKL